MNKIAEIQHETVSENITADTQSRDFSIRVAPNSYFQAFGVLMFCAAFFLYADWIYASVAVGIIAFLIVPVLAFFDRITFDGKRLYRTGILPNAWATLTGTRSYLKIIDIEQVETQSLRALKRGGSVFYRYKSTFRGRGTVISFASGGEAFRKMVAAIFPLVNENALDNRSLDIRDYVCDPKEALMKAEFARIPSPDVLQYSLTESEKSPRNSMNARLRREVTKDDVEKSAYLRRIGNELRISGYLIQAVEAFRRASLLNPRDGGLLFEFAMCLNSFANSEKNMAALKKSNAILRLAEKYSRDNIERLSRIGEYYFQTGDMRRSESAFRRSGDERSITFRAARGLAEIALRDGKLAHVIHNFMAAQSIAETPALRRWTQTEADYFTRLNSDEEYMEMEISRINMLGSFERGRKTTFRLAVLGLPFILFGLVANDALVADIGWAVSVVALFIWTGLFFSQRMFSERIPLDILIEEE